MLGHRHKEGHSLNTHHVGTKLHIFIFHLQFLGNIDTISQDHFRLRPCRLSFQSKHIVVSMNLFHDPNVISNHGTIPNPIHSDDSLEVSQTGESNCFIQILGSVSSGNLSLAETFLVVLNAVHHHHSCALIGPEQIQSTQAFCLSLEQHLSSGRCDFKTICIPIITDGIAKVSHPGKAQDVGDSLLVEPNSLLELVKLGCLSCA